MKLAEKLKVGVKTSGGRHTATCPICGEVAEVIRCKPDDIETWLFGSGCEHCYSIQSPISKPLVRCSAKEIKAVFRDHPLPETWTEAEPWAFSPREIQPGYGQGHAMTGQTEMRHPMIVQGSRTTYY